MTYCLAGAPCRRACVRVCGLYSALEYCVITENLSLSAIRTVRVLRPLRAINRIPSTYDASALRKLLPISNHRLSIIGQYLRVFRLFHHTVPHNKLFGVDMTNCAISFSSIFSCFYSSFFVYLLFCCYHMLAMVNKDYHYKCTTSVEST